MSNNQSYTGGPKHELAYEYILVTVLLSLITVLTYGESLLISVQFMLLTFITLLICKQDGVFKLLVGYITFVPMLIILIALLSSSKSSVLYSAYMSLDKMNIGFTLQSTRLTFLISISLLGLLTLATKENNRINVPKMIRRIFVTSLYITPIVLLTIG